MLSPFRSRSPKPVSSSSAGSLELVRTDTAVVPIGSALGHWAGRGLEWPTPERFGVESSQRLRIAIVSPEVGAGAGVPHYWLALAGALAQEHDVDVFTAKTDRDGLEGVTFHKVPALSVGWFLSHMTFYLAARVRFLFHRLSFQKPFDVVLGVGALTPFADVTTVHFVQAREIELQRQGLIPRPRPLAGLAALDYRLYSRTMAWLGARFYRKSKASIVAISQSVKQDIALFEGANPAAISVVPNGVDVGRFSPANRERYRDEMREFLGLADTDVAVLFVGNSWGRKGLRTAIEAIDGPGQSDVRLIVVGDGDPSSFVQTLLKEVAERIIFVGPKSTDVERYYAASDIFMLPTLYEPFGLVILEALASGLPSIFSACAGASEWLEDGVDALFLRDPADGNEARMALQAVISSPELATRLSENGRIAAEMLQWSSVGQQLIETATSRKLLLAATA
jgi:UDP-glucose:(heptosyl)LPS alpha-1,3-glucosyltransferase